MDNSYYLIIDFEATCCDKNSIPRAETEIIEVGAVMVAADSLKIVDEFSTFVRPVRHPQLTAFCTELTSITQDQVEAAPVFAEVVLSLRDWADKFQGYFFCSWGDYDRNQLRRECDRNSIPYPFTDDHINLKKRFSERLGTQRKFGMAGALRKLNIPLDGTHHRGIDDARNIAKLLPFIVGD